MKRVNMHDAKTHFSQYVSELRAGEALVLCNRNRPVARLTSLARKARKPRIGAARDELIVPDSFFEPLPRNILQAFYGDLVEP